MRRRRLPILFAITAAIAGTIPAIAAQASQSPAGNPGGTGTTTTGTTTTLTVTLPSGTVVTPPAHPRPYVNPFANPAWEVSRTDMGVDWVPVHKLPVQAIGDSVVLGSHNHAPWPGHHLIWYELLDGSHAGDIVYVAEHLKDLIKAGTVVHAGQQIALAVPGFPYTEWGWADAYGSPRAWPCYRNGHPTASGREMARFLAHLGVAAESNAGRGPDHPLGKRCS